MRRAAGLLGLLLAGAAGPAAGQGGPAPAPDTFTVVERVEVSWSPVTAVVLRFPGGSALDPPDAEGAAWLLAHSLVHQARDALREVAATLSVEVERSAVELTLLTPAGEAAGPLRTLLDVLLRSPLRPGAVETARQELRALHGFEAGAPVREFQEETARLLTSPGDPWSRPPRGHPATVEGLDLPALEALRPRLLDPLRAGVAVVGPRARAPLPTAEGGIRRAVPPPSPTPAWTEGRRVVVTREITATWTAVAFPAPPASDPTTLEFLLHALREVLDLSPPPPGVLTVSLTLEATPGGPVLLVTAALLPEAVDTWEGRVREALDELRNTPLDPELFREHRRRFRAALLLREAAREVLARRVLRDRMEANGVRDLPARIWTLTPRDLREAARALGPPRVLRLGPDLTDRGGTRDFP